MKIVDAFGRSKSRLGAVGALVAVLLSGCPGQSTGIRPRGDELLEKVQSAYEHARSYEDAAKLTQMSPETGDKQEVTFSVAYAKPNKLRVEAGEVSMVCDGKHLWSAIDADILSPQVLFLPAPTEMSLEAIYQEPLLNQMLGGGGDGLPLPQLELLFGNQPLKHLFGDELTTKWLGEKSLPGEDSLCHALEVKGSRGIFELWIDPKTYVLRRLEVLDPNGSERIIGSIDFKGARLDGDVPENAFKFEAPATARLVNRFVLPPVGLERMPSEFLGEQPASFQFVDLEGKPVDLASLAGRVVVFDFWDISCSWCFKSFPNLNKVYRQYADNPKVAILTVNQDPAELSNEKLRNIFKDKGLELPILRDPDHYGEKVFKVPGHPTMIILGADGTVQGYELGYKADLAETLPKTIDRLLAGEHVAEEGLATYRRIRAGYERQLAEATVGVNQEIELQRAKIAPRSEPEKLRLEKTWSTDDIKNPGNLIVYRDAEGNQRIAVLDGWRTVVELNGAGKTLGRHELDLPEAAVATLLRTATDAQGRRTFAAFAISQRKVFLLDQEWKSVASFPEETRQGISDVQLADVDGDGQLEMLVGYLGEVGVQCASLSGERVWSNRAFENVLSLAVLPRDPDGHHRVLVGNERPALGVVDYTGTQLADIPVPSRPIDIIVAANLASRADSPSGGDGKEASDSSGQELWKLAALSATKPAEFVAVGLDLRGSETWTYALPVGVRNTPCDMLIAGQLRTSGPGEWLLTGADGSIHILSAEGEPLDHFQYGDELTGIGSLTVDGQPLLLVATAHALTAWKVINESAPVSEAPADATEGDATASEGSTENPSEADAPILGPPSEDEDNEPTDKPVAKTASSRGESDAGE